MVSGTSVIEEHQALTAGGKPIQWTRVKPILDVMCLKDHGAMAAARAAAGLPEPRVSWPREKAIEFFRTHSSGEPYPCNRISAAQSRFGTRLSAVKAADVPTPSGKRRRRS